MEIVQPIRDKEKINQIKSILKQNNIRDYFLFCLGIYTGLRISDILKLKVGDLKNKDRFQVEEQKTGKNRNIIIHPSIKEELQNYIKDMNNDWYIFKSQKGDNQPIKRVQAYRILNDAAHQVGLNEIGTHTLRKTFGYQYYKQTNNLTLLQKIFNHSSSNVTLRYIGILQDDIDMAIECLDF